MWYVYKYNMYGRHPHLDEQVQMHCAATVYNINIVSPRDMASQSSSRAEGSEGIKVAKLRELFQTKSDTALLQGLATDKDTSEVLESAKKTNHCQSNPSKLKDQDGKQL